VRESDQWTQWAGPVCRSACFALSVCRSGCSGPCAGVGACASDSDPTCGGAMRLRVCARVRVRAQAVSGPPLMTCNNVMIRNNQANNDACRELQGVSSPVRKPVGKREERFLSGARARARAQAVSWPPHARLLTCNPPPTHTHTHTTNRRHWPDGVSERAQPDHDNAGTLQVPRC
jgi:hypothetical protein